MQRLSLRDKKREIAKLNIYKLSIVLLSYCRRIKKSGNTDNLQHTLKNKKIKEGNNWQSDTWQNTFRYSPPLLAYLRKKECY